MADKSKLTEEDLTQIIKSTTKEMMEDEEAPAAAVQWERFLLRYGDALFGEEANKEEKCLARMLEKSSDSPETEKGKVIYLCDRKRKYLDNVQETSRLRNTKSPENGVVIIPDSFAQNRPSPKDSIPFLRKKDGKKGSRRGLTAVLLTMLVLGILIAEKLK